MFEVIAFLLLVELEIREVDFLFLQLAFEILNEESLFFLEFRDDSFEVRAGAVLQEHAVHFPDVREELSCVECIVKYFGKRFIEA